MCRCELQIRNPRVDPPVGRGYDVLIRVEFDFAILVDGETRLAEEMFTAVELAYVLARWLRVACASGPGFEFDSMDDERLGLVWLRPLRPDGALWGVGSSETAPDPLASLSWTDAKELVTDFVADVIAQIRSEFGFDVGPILGGVTDVLDGVRAVWRGLLSI